MTSSSTDKTESIYNIFIGGLAFLLLFPIGGGLTRNESEYAPLAYLFGVVLMIYYIFLYVGSNPFAKLVSAQKGSKWFFLVISIFISLESSRVTSIAINSVFGIDASALPSTLFVVSALNIFLMSKYLFVAFTAWGIITFIGYLIVIFVNKSEILKVPTFLFAISGMVVGGMCLLFINNNEGSIVNKKIYTIAHSFDFNGNIVCNGVRLKGSGIFLGPEQKLVFMDYSDTDLPSWYEALYYNSNKFENIILPNEYSKIECK